MCRDTKQLSARTLAVSYAILTEPTTHVGSQVRDAGGVAEATICYTGDVSDPSKTKYTLVGSTTVWRKTVTFPCNRLEGRSLRL